MENTEKQRAHFIDWIRVIAFLMLILFHSTMPFVKFGWEIKNSETSPILDTIIIWFHQWRLPLLFFVSGVGVSFSLKSRSVLAFAGERLVRLFIPLLFAMFFTIPFQVYFEWMQTGRINQSYLSFYPSVWDLVPYPKGSLTWSHMWFVVYLFVFTFLLLPVFSLFKIPYVLNLKLKLDKIFKQPLVCLLLAIPFIWNYYQLYLKWPEQGSLLDDWFVFVSSISYFFVGFLLADLPSFWESCEKYRSLFLTIALICSFMLMLKYYWNVELPKKQDLNLYLYGFLAGLFIWTTILASMGYAKKYLNFSNQYLVYLNSAVFPFYILHQTIIVTFGYYIVQWNTIIFVKWLMIVLSTALALFTIFHVIIRNTIVTRLLYGMKWKQKAEDSLSLNLSNFQR